MTKEKPLENNTTLYAFTLFSDTISLPEDALEFGKNLNIGLKTYFNILREDEKGVIHKTAAG